MLPEETGWHLVEILEDNLASLSALLEEIRKSPFISLPTIENPTLSPILKLLPTYTPTAKLLKTLKLSNPFQPSGSGLAPMETSPASTEPPSVSQPSCTPTVIPQHVLSPNLRLLYDSASGHFVPVQHSTTECATT